MHAAALSAGLLACLLTACAGYRLGPTHGLAAGSRSVHVVAFENQTMQPRLSGAVVQALRRQLQQDGTYRLASRHDADVLLTGRFVNLERASITYSPHDLRTTRDEELRVVARVVARDLRTGTTLLDREVVGRVTVRIGANQTSAERQALPVLAADLASKTVPLLVDGEW